VGYGPAVSYHRWVAVGLLGAVAFSGASACSDTEQSSASDAGFIEAAGAAGSAGAGGASEASGHPPQDLPDVPIGAGVPCNGTPALCDKSYSSLTFLGTHWSMASDDSWATQTQGRSLRDQLLVGGVRALELEIHSDNGVLAVCAGSCSAGSQSLASVLREVESFVQGNATDVLTLLLRSSAPPSALAQAFDDQGLVELAHSQAPGKPWPTLQMMIDAQRRLVVFLDQVPADRAADAGLPDASDASDASDVQLPPWLHRLSDWAWETAASEGKDCAVSHGDPQSPLAILNHYVPGEAATDATLAAAHVAEVVAARLARCNDDRKHVPNFVLVDFAEIGDPNGGAQIANGVR
jgi:hypothetical protein